MATIATIAEIARLAGVHPSTVSRVLRGHPGFNVGDECRDRILKIARELNYAPQIAGRSLVSGKSYTIVAALGDMERDLASPFLAPVMTALTRTLWTKGYALALMPVDARDRRTLNRDMMQIIRESRADGYFIPQLFLNAATMALLQQRRRPVVTFAGRNGGIATGGIVSAVVLDEQPGADGVAQALAQLGHRRVLYVRPYPHQDLRYEALRKALRREGIACDANDCLTYNPPQRGFLHDRPSAQLAAAANMSKLLEYSAVVCCSDLVVLGVMDALCQQGVEPGKDISVVGYDNIEENANFQMDKPMLATIDRGAHERGRAAAELLLERLEQPNRAPSVRVVPTRFIQRMSIAKPKGGASS